MAGRSPVVALNPSVPQHEVDWRYNESGACRSVPMNGQPVGLRRSLLSDAEKDLKAAREQALLGNYEASME
eukprot:5714523-Amphidinium_carterae.1